MNNDMNAEAFVGTMTFRLNQLEVILRCCVDIYNEIVAGNRRTKNKENQITDLFYEYLSDDSYRARTGFLSDFHFEREAKENEGFLDIKVKPIKEYESTRAYYIIECKRLDGNKTLNDPYVKNGICRFVSGYYSSFYSMNAMFGFLVKSVDIRYKVVDRINPMLNETLKNDHGEYVNANATQPMQYEDFAGGYPYSFVSKHSRDGGTAEDGNELTIYHLIFDLSKNII